MTSIKGGDEEPLLIRDAFMKPRHNFVHSLVARGLASIRPYAPQLIPFLICTIFIPFLVLLSISAGLLVWNSLSVSWEIPLYLQYGDGIPPYASFELPRLIPNQKYDISVELNVPLTDSNFALGNFMTSLSLETLSNKTVAQVRRAAITTPATNILPFFKKTRTHIKIPLLQSFISSSSRLVGTVDVGRRDHWRTLGTGQGQELNIISASLQGLAVPHGIRGLAIRFPLTASILASGLFLVILSTILAGCILPLVLPLRSPSPDPFTEGESSALRERRAADVPAPLSRRSSSRRSPEREVKPEQEEIKMEESDTSDPPALRRRLSRPNLDTSDSDA